MPSPPRLAIAAVFLGIAASGVVAVFRPRSRAGLAVWITSLLMLWDLPSGTDRSTRAYGVFIALLFVVLAGIALWYHTPH